MSNKEKTIDILLVEDNEGDVFLTRKAFQKAKIINNIRVAPDGEIAMAMLRREGEFLNTHLPDLVLLDINLPKKDGKTVLKEIRETRNIRDLPVIILSSSSVEQELLRESGLATNLYLTKPINLEKFHQVVSSVDNFWFKIISTPEN